MDLHCKLNPGAKAKQVAGVISHDLWYFLCRTDKVGLRRVSLQRAHALRMILPERERERRKKRKKKKQEGGREVAHQTGAAKTHQVEMGSNSLRPELMYGEACR